MVTTNANSSRPRENRSNENQKNSHGTQGTDGRSSNQKRDYEKKAYQSNGAGHNNERRENQRANQNEGKRFGQKNSQAGERKTYNAQQTNKGANGYKGVYQKKENGGGYYRDRANQDSEEGQSNHRMRDRRTPGTAKEKEQQPDKLETMKRLEKEKKVMQKKKEGKKGEHTANSRPQKKKRRINRIDWTRGYENGLYGEDDEEYTEYS